MPSHQERREPLPKDYQFGDARGVSNKLSISFVRQFDIVADQYTGYHKFREYTHLWHCAITQRPHHECTCGVEGPDE